MIDFSDKVAAVVITFNCGDDFIDNLSSYVNQVATVIIVDNGSGSTTLQTLIECRRRFPDKVITLLNPLNLGIAAAQNAGMTEALRRGFEWIVLFDHDSSVDEQMLGRLYRYAATAQKTVGVIGPSIYDVNISKYNRCVVKTWGPFFKRVELNRTTRTDVLAVFASGSMIRAAMLSSVGMMRERFFIDFVDTEFCLRCIVAGYQVVVVGDAVLNHRLGEREIKHFGGLSFKPTHHSTLRKYYMARNRLTMWREYIGRVPSYVLFDLAAAALDLFRVLVFETDRRAKLRATFRGYLHGIRCIDGPVS